MIACNCWPGRLAAAEESWADTIEKRHQRRRRGPLDQDAAPDDPAGKAEFLESNNAGPWPAAVGPNRDADL